MAALLPRCTTLADTRSRRGPKLLILLLASLVAAIVIWAGLARVEQVVRATGQVEPEARLQIVNHDRGGRVAEVLVREGEEVAAGAVLVRLDTEIDGSALSELRARLASEQIRVARLEAELGDTPLVVAPSLSAARPDLMAEAAALLAAERSALSRRLAELATSERQRAMEHAERVAEIHRLESTLELFNEEAEAVGQLAERGLAPRLRHVGIERRVADAEGELAVAKSAGDAALAAREEVAAARARLLADWESEVRQELAAARAAAFDLEQAVTRQTRIVGDLHVRAPTDGIVKDLAVTTPGQSFQAFAPLLTLVPTGGPLVVEAKVPQRDIGKLHAGQSATVKVMAFDYLRYGSLDAEVARIAADASTDERTGDVIYSVLLKTERPALERGGQSYPLVPGMLVDVELITGERSILSFLTDRILLLRDDAFAES